MLPLERKLRPVSGLQMGRELQDPPPGHLHFTSAHLLILCLSWACTVRVPTALACPLVSQHHGGLWSTRASLFAGDASVPLLTSDQRSSSVTPGPWGPRDARGQKCFYTTLR